MSTEPEPFDTVAIGHRLIAAQQMVSDLCHGRREWIMSIPVRPERDPDTVIAASLRDVTACLAEIARLAVSLTEARLLADGENERCEVCRKIVPTVQMEHDVEGVSLCPDCWLACFSEGN